MGNILTTSVERKNILRQIICANPKELSLNNFHISGRYPLPEKPEQLLLLRGAGGGPRSFTKTE